MKEQPTTSQEFFARNKPRNFPLPKRRKPYSQTASWTHGDFVVESARKDTGTGRVRLLEDEEVVGALYLQGVTWAEISREAELLKDIVRRGEA